MWEETRKVTKTGEVSLKGIVFDAGASLVNKKVDLRFDPFNLSVVEIWHNGLFIRKAYPLVVPEYIHGPKNPKQEPARAPTGAPSRLLAAYEKRNEQREKQKNGAIAFADLQEDTHV
jgi:hypothetical protein